MQLLVQDTSSDLLYWMKIITFVDLFILIHPQIIKSSEQLKGKWEMLWFENNKLVFL
jgi:hypothetical protein